MLRDMFKKTYTKIDTRYRAPEAERTEKQEEEPGIPAGMWRKCNKCGKPIYVEDVRENFYVCPKCGGYFRVHAWRRLQMVTDPGTFEEWDREMEVSNPLNFPGYEKKLEAAREKSRLNEAIVTGCGKIGGNPAVIGVSEIENRSILEDIASTRKLLPARYAICHYDSPDLRGVDVAFLYRPDVFKLEGSADIPVRIASLPNWRTRGIVTMWGTIDGEPFLFMVAHWPSRLGGQAASAFKRNAAADQMRAIADSVLKVNPATKIVAMGDFNDDPTDESVEVHLGAKAKIKELQPGDFYTPFADMLKAGLGTLAYRDAWNLFDNIVVSENLATGSAGKLKLVKDPYKKTKFYGNIFKPSYLIQQEGQYKGYPLRTFVGNNFQGGFSDHLPVFIYIAK